MSNIVNIGSANIAAFGFQAFFDLDQKSLTLDITGQTTFVGSGINNVLGIAFNIKGPGNLILATADFSAPQIMPAASPSFEIDLPGSYGMFGFYTIEGQIQDADGTIYKTAVIVKEITQPDCYEGGSVPGKIEIVADCDLPQVLVSESTTFVYQENAPTSISRAGKLVYPPATLSDLTFTSLPFAITGANKVYTGRYTVNNKSIASYDLGYGIIVLVPYVVNQLEKVVDCSSSLTEILCCIEEVQATYKKNPLSVSGKNAKDKLNRITIPFYAAILQDKSGADSSANIAEIKDILKCDCGCGSSGLAQPKALIGGGVTANNIVAAGQHAANASSATVGSTQTITVDVKFVTVSNQAADPAFTVTRSESSSTINFGLTFNYHALASSILTEIQNDDDLTSLLTSIMGSAMNAPVSLDGLNSSCVLTIGNCSYSLTDSTVPAKTVKSITIGGVVKTAPNGLLFTNAAGIASWLNGLALGTFTANYDAGSKTTVIQSATNPNVITQLQLANGAALINRQFTRSCVGLVDVLNAITAYLCAIDTTKIAFGVAGQSITSFVNNVATSTPIASDINLSDLLIEMLAAQNQLFNQIGNIALSCTSMKALFKVTAGTINKATDVLYGTKAGACAAITYADVAAQNLAVIAADPTLKALFCSIVSSCSAPTCAAPTNVSVVLISGPACTSVTNMTGSIS